MTPPIHQALQFLQQNRPADALKILQALPSQSAIDPNIDFLCAIALSMLGKKAQAVDTYKRVIARNPANAGAYLNLGADLYSLERYDEAMSSLSQAQSLDPHNPMVALNIGNVHKAKGSTGAALAAYELALTHQPNYAEAWSNRGEVLCLLGRRTEAVASYERALAINPAFPDALNNLGLTHIEEKRFSAGIATLERAIALHPGFAMAHNNLGIAFFKVGQPEKGLAAYQRAIALDAKRPDPYFNLAEALVNARQYEEAIAFYQKAMACSATPEAYMGALLHAKMKICDWVDFDKNTNALQAAIDKNPHAISPFTVLGLPSTSEQQKRCAEAFVKKVYPYNPDLIKPGAISTPSLPKKIRVGYLSSDLYAHATAYLMAELFELHDRSRFEIIAFSYGKAPADTMRERIKQSVDAFHEVSDLSDPEVANLIRSTGIDILVDLKGHTEGARLGILTHRPAPIQIHYLGYPGTLGAPFIDYVIADNVLITPDDYKDYSEKIVHLPGSYQVNDRLRRIAKPQDDRSAHGLPATGFVYCCFNNNWKITPTIFDVWMRLLAAHPQSVLWLIGDNPSAISNLRKEAENRGISASRLVFAPKLPLDEHLARHQHADLFLDTPFYNAHTTASDALWAGLPVLTLHGNTYAGRVGESLLSALHLNSLVATDLTHYEQIAHHLTNEPANLLALKHQLANALTNGALFDTPRFARGLENAFETMVTYAQQGLPPTHILVADSA